MRIRPVLATAWMAGLSGIVHGAPLGAVVPEPETLALIGVFVIALFVARWQNRE